ncbi:aldose 1-epimerase [Sphingopyxis sp.]|uniref:aldose 1-epimerase n=1 Tax=Sphingopyxis sp. TaxID=1908224 RepID=UPI002B4A3B5D|nr:aldose 1-epimerase [Sphingopyxis sp.]HJS12665.1 aldose 1-epimerase [Sphingopyxis sp.]
MSADRPFATRTLTAGPSRLTLVPEAGGAIAAWRIGDQPMFYESGIAAQPGWDPRATASFPLVPYSNRIGGGSFMWDGLARRLPPNMAGFVYPLHGVGWLRGWAVTESTDAHAVLRYEHRGDADWPWAFSAEQRFALAPEGLTVDLIVTNRSAGAVPLAIGMHPYFDAAKAHLQFTAEQMWLAGADQLPLRAIASDTATDFAAGRAIAGCESDNCYDGWDGRAAIWWDDRPLGLTILSDLSCAVVYTPADARFFCFEPVPHGNNALNLGGAGQPMPVAAPGETIRARIAFDAWERI